MAALAFPNHKIRRLKPLLQKHEVGLRRLHQPAQAGFVLFQPRMPSPGKSNCFYSVSKLTPSVKCRTGFFEI
jgi:hypothetical protein